MQRSSTRALAQPRWVRLFDHDELEAELVPAGMPDLTGSRLWGITTEILEREMCTRAFVGFRGFEDDGRPIENSLEARIELYRVPAIRTAINNALQVLNNEILVGEAVAASA